MFALETRALPGNEPNIAAQTPFHPETHQGLANLDVLNLPSDEARKSGTNWMPTGFTISGTPDFIRAVLKGRFFHNPRVGYTFRDSDRMVVEYEYQAQSLPF